jgi:hypothetical protein
VLRTRETRCSSSAIEDEVGGFQARCASGSINCRERRKSRAAVLSQAGAALSWTSERACERVRKAAAHERQPERAERAMGMEGDEVFFLGDRGRSKRLPSAMRERLQQEAPSRE